MLAGIAHVLGLDMTGAWYGFWSGICGDLALVGGAIAVVRRHQCHVGGCWRLGRHPAGRYHVCRRHHPHLDRAPTADDVRAHLEPGGTEEAP